MRVALNVPGCGIRYPHIVGWGENPGMGSSHHLSLAALYVSEQYRDDYWHNLQARSCDCRRGSPSMLKTDVIALSVAISMIND